MLDALDLLVCLVALAGQHDHIGISGDGQRVANRLAAVLYHGIFATGVANSFLNLVENFERIFVAGVVAGEDDQVGQLSGDFAHDGPFAVVAVAAAAKQGNQAAPGGFAHGFQDVFQAVGRVRVIKDNAVRRFRFQKFDASRYGAHVFQAVANGFRAYAQRDGHARGQQGVVNVENA